MDGFNLGQPVIVGNMAYLSTIGSVGKIDLNTGKYVWKFDNLYENGKYNNFYEPVFHEGDLVLFSDGQNSILINDRKGEILKMD